MKRVCGLDVHKDNAFVCILGENGEKIEFKTGVLTVELDSFRERLVELGVGEVAMESTAVYWMPIWRILESDFRPTFMTLTCFSWLASISLIRVSYCCLMDSASDSSSKRRSALIARR